MKEITTTELCYHCNEQIAKFTSSKKKLCCEKNVAKCPAVKKKIGQANKDKLLSVNEITGLSMAKSYANERKENAKLCNKEDPYKTAARKMLSSRNENNSYKTGAIKTLATKSLIGDDGLTIIERSTKKMVESRNKVGADGLTNFERAANKSTQTRFSNIDDCGRNGFDRMWIKAGQAKIFDGTNLYYRSTYEKKFLDKIVAEYGLEWVILKVSNPKSISYSYDGRDRKYIPDFLIQGIYYEVKSSYTWDDFGKNLEWQNKNIAKLESLHTNGFNVILVLDGILHKWEDYRNQYDTLG